MPVITRGRVITGKNTAFIRIKPRRPDYFNSLLFLLNWSQLEDAKDKDSRL